MKLPGIKTAITLGERTYVPSLTQARECGLDYYTIIWPLSYGDFQSVFSFILGANRERSEEIPIVNNIKLQPSSRDDH
jgi:hypothetical protein